MAAPQSGAPWAPRVAPPAGAMHALSLRLPVNGLSAAQRARTVRGPESVRPSNWGRRRTPPVAVRHRAGEDSPTPLTKPELKALSSLAPLVRSPREAKRLLNLYRMLRSTRDLNDASRFLGAEGASGEFQAVVMLLGLLTANPQLLGQILFAPPDAETELMGGICYRAAPSSWAAFLDGLWPHCVGGRWRNDLCGCLSERDRAEWELLVERAKSASALVKLLDLTTFKT